MPRPEKEKLVEMLAEKLSRNRVAILTDYQGLNVSAMTDLREQFRKADIEYRVFKNTLGRIAAAKAGHEALLQFIEGPTGYAFAEDPVLPAKVLTDFMKANPNMKIKCALITGRLFDQAQVQSIATLPPRDVLLGQILAQIMAPMTGLATAMNGVIQKLAYALDDLRRKKEAA
ncbi:MAG: 50S ribosomal protein L10 [Candidatus Abyssubacteria bacterium]